MTTVLYTSEHASFGKRREAGQLSTWLTDLSAEHPVVVGIAPEGMPLAAEIAHALGAPLDTVVVEPLSLGSLPADRFGVAAEGGIALFDPDRRAQVDACPAAADSALLDAEARLQRRSAPWREGRRRQSLSGRTVLLVAESLVDERLAAAAACAVRDRGAAQVVILARKARLEAVLAVEDWSDEIVGLELIDDELSPDRLDDSSPVSDETVRALLRENRDECRRARRQHVKQ